MRYNRSNSGGGSMLVVAMAGYSAGDQSVTPLVPPEDITFPTNYQNCYEVWRGGHVTTGRFRASLPPPGTMEQKLCIGRMGEIGPYEKNSSKIPLAPYEKIPTMSEVEKRAVSLYQTGLRAYQTLLDKISGGDGLMDHQDYGDAVAEYDCEGNMDWEALNLRLTKMDRDDEAASLEEETARMEKLIARLDLEREAALLEADLAGARQELEAEGELLKLQIDKSMRDAEEPKF